MILIKERPAFLLLDSSEHHTIFELLRLPTAQRQQGDLQSTTLVDKDASSPSFRAKARFDLEEIRKSESIASCGIRTTMFDKNRSVHPTPVHISCARRRPSPSTGQSVSSQFICLSGCLSVSLSVDPWICGFAVRVGRCISHKCAEALVQGILLAHFDHSW